MSTIITTIVLFILGFLIQAVALKVSLGMLGQAQSKNKFSTALGVTLLLSVALFITGFVPLFGWFLKPLVWLLVIMVVYKIGFFKSLGVAFVQLIIQLGLKWLLALIGIGYAGQHLLV